MQNSPVIFCQYLAKHNRQYARNKYLTNMVFIDSWFCFLLTCFIISCCRISSCLKITTSLELLLFSMCTLLFWVILIFSSLFCASVHHVGASNPFLHWCLCCIQMRMTEEFKWNNLKYCILGAGETTQQLWICMTFEEDQSWVPSTYVGWLLTACKSSSRDPVVSFDPHGHLDSWHILIHRYTNTQSQHKEFFKNHPCLVVAWEYIS